jgi:hypothetical protein
MSRFVSNLRRSCFKESLKPLTFIFLVATLTNNQNAYADCANLTRAVNENPEPAVPATGLEDIGSWFRNGVFRKGNFVGVRSNIERLQILSKDAEALGIKLDIQNLNAKNKPYDNLKKISDQVYTLNSVQNTLTFAKQHGVEITDISKLQPVAARELPFLKTSDAQTLHRIHSAVSNLCIKFIRLALDFDSKGTFLSPYEIIVSPFMRAAPPLELNRDIVDGIEGIVKLWNNPTMILKVLSVLRQKIDERSKRLDISRAETLEQLRREYETRHGFAEPIDLSKNPVSESTSLISTDQWNQLLRLGHPLYDFMIAHSFFSERPNSAQAPGAQVHRNQWLLIMMAMEDQPAIFGSFRGTAVQLFKAFGGEWINNWQIEMPKNYESLLQNTKSLWYFLFDRVSKDESNPSEGYVSNFSNPSYFVEVFSEASGLKTHE